MWIRAPQLHRPLHSIRRYSMKHRYGHWSPLKSSSFYLFVFIRIESSISIYIVLSHVPRAFRWQMERPPDACVIRLSITPSSIHLTSTHSQKFPSPDSQHAASCWAPAAPQDMESSKVRRWIHPPGIDPLTDVATGLPMRRPPRLYELNYTNQLNMPPSDINQPTHASMPASLSIASLPSARVEAATSPPAPRDRSSRPSGQEFRPMLVPTRPLASLRISVASPAGPPSPLHYAPI